MKTQEYVTTRGMRAAVGAFQVGGVSVEASLRWSATRGERPAEASSPAAIAALAPRLKRSWRPFGWR